MLCGLLVLNTTFNEITQCWIGTIHHLEERLIAEQAILNLRELNKTCDAAPDGKVFAIAETMAMNQGRALIRKTLETSLALQATDVEKKRHSQNMATPLLCSRKN